MSKITLTKNSVFQDLSLSDIFGLDLSSYPDIGLAFGQAAIDIMLERTASGVDKNGNAFARYSDSYKDSLEFKAFGKSNQVNMNLEGNMLSDLDILDFNGNDLKIGFKDTVENNKAYNHNTGDTLPKREFFGLTNDEIEALKLSFQSQVDDAVSSASPQQLLNLLGASGTASTAANQAILNELNDDFFGDTLDFI